MTHDDLIKRLRAPQNWFSESDEGHRGPNDAPEKAADSIEYLLAQNVKLREALRMPVELADNNPKALSNELFDSWIEHPDGYLAAKAALEDTP